MLVLLALLVGRISGRAAQERDQANQRPPGTFNVRVGYPTWYCIFVIAVWWLVICCGLVAWLG